MVLYSLFLMATIHFTLSTSGPKLPPWSWGPSSHFAVKVSDMFSTLGLSPPPRMYSSVSLIIFLGDIFQSPNFSSQTPASLHPSVCVLWSYSRRRHFLYTALCSITPSPSWISRRRLSMDIQTFHLPIRFEPPSRHWAVESSHAPARADLCCSEHLLSRLPSLLNVESRPPSRNPFADQHGPCFRGSSSQLPRWCTRGVPGLIPPYISIHRLDVLLVQSGLFVRTNGLFRYHYSRANISQAGGAVRIRIHSQRRLRIKTGQYINLWIPFVSFWSFTQSHPFVVISWAAGEQDNLDLFIEPRRGLTRDILYHAKNSHVFNPLVMFSGPYGKSVSMEGYETILMVASGFGIAAQLPYLKRLIHGYNAREVRARRIHLIWQIEDTGETPVAHRSPNEAHKSRGRNRRPIAAEWCISRG